MKITKDIIKAYKEYLKRLNEIENELENTNFDIELAIQLFTEAKFLYKKCNEIINELQNNPFQVIFQLNNDFQNKIIYEMDSSKSSVNKDIFDSNYPLEKDLNVYKSTLIRRKRKNVKKDKSLQLELFYIR